MDGIRLLAGVAPAQSGSVHSTFDFLSGRKTGVSNLENISFGSEIFWEWHLQ